MQICASQSQNFCDRSDGNPIYTQKTYLERMGMPLTVGTKTPHDRKYQTPLQTPLVACNHQHRLRGIRGKPLFLIMVTSWLDADKEVCH
ncbi:hypothetical protein COCOBI_17-0830 [Coccomyxa sp. Obi]|nr:hypothetical protein COCOBI_17-0830 [Coccomyxa sp. Obi]